MRLPLSWRLRQTASRRSTCSARSALRPSQKTSSATRLSRSRPVRRRCAAPRRIANWPPVSAVASRPGSGTTQTSLPKPSAGGGRPGSTTAATPAGTTLKPSAVRQAKTRIIHSAGTTPSPPQTGVRASGGVCTAQSRSPIRARRSRSGSSGFSSRSSACGSPPSAVSGSMRHCPRSASTCSRAPGVPSQRQGASTRRSSSPSRYCASRCA